MDRKEGFMKNILRSSIPGGHFNRNCFGVGLPAISSSMSSLLDLGDLAFLDRHGLISGRVAALDSRVRCCPETEILSATIF